MKILNKKQLEGVGLAKLFSTYCDCDGRRVTYLDITVILVRQGSFGNLMWDGVWRRHILTHEKVMPKQIMYNFQQVNYY